MVAHDLKLEIEMKLSLEVVKGNQVWGFEMTVVGTWGHCFLYVVAQVGAEQDMKARFLVEKAMSWLHQKQTRSLFYIAPFEI